MAAFVLLLAATAIASYLAWVSFDGRAAIGCGPESGCDKVLHSKWAQWFGLPVSLMAIPVYLAGAICAFRLRTSQQCQRGWLMASAGSLLLLGAAGWFTAVQLFVIKAVCPFCMSAHLLGVVAAGLLLLARKGRGVQFSLLSCVQAASIALLLLAALFAGQVVYKQKSFEVATMSGPLPARTDRVLPIYGGQHQLKLDELPIIGKPSAPHVIVSLFDYTCHHCRTMHGVLMQVQRSFSNQLAVISLPMPLDPACNTTLKRAHPDHVNACEYARTGLAVWRARPSAHAAYEEWVFTPEKPPPIAEAQKHAIDLLGIMAFETALRDPWIDAQIQRDIAIYDTAFRAGQGSMPQLIIGSKVAVGTIPIENVYQLLANELGLKAATPIAQ
jgi:uncharacterized membrane protein/protein-disulfide isomerase